jgi:hypothetical protein
MTDKDSQKGNISDRDLARQKQEEQETQDNWQALRASQRQDTERGGGRSK